MNANVRHLVVAGLLVSLSGCGLFGKKKDQAVSRPLPESAPSAPPEARPKTLAIANGSTGKLSKLPDPVPPPPPDLIIAEMPVVQPKDTAIVAQPKAAGVPETIIPAAGVAPIIEPPPRISQPIRTPSPANPAPANPAPGTTRETTTAAPAPENQLQALKRLQQLAAEKMTRVDGFEARLTRRETIGISPMPEQTIQYRYRIQPKSMHLKWIGVEGKGRELVYVGGRKEESVEILTARGDGFALTPAGKRLAFPPTAPPIRNQSRYDLREGGMPMAIINLGASLAKAERDPSVAGRFKYLGLVKRSERPSGFEAIEETLPSGLELLFPRGGKRTLFFDPDPASPSHGLPILVTAANEAGKDVEYYFFDQFKPMKFTDADFDPNVLWKK